ncbi:hypothetical protein [Aeromonas veronii]
MVTTTGNNVYDMVSASWMALFFCLFSSPHPAAAETKRASEMLAL